MAKYVTEKLAGLKFEPELAEFINEAVILAYQSTEDYPEKVESTDLRQFMTLYVNARITSKLEDIWQVSQANHLSQESFFSFESFLLKNLVSEQEGSYLLPDDYIRKKIEQKFSSN